MPNINKSNPEILLISTIFLCVSFLLNLPANNTFPTSAAKLTKMQVEKITIRSLTELAMARVVAVVSQKAITAGLSVLIKKPAMANLACVLAETRMAESSTLRNFIFLNKNAFKSVQNI